MAELGSSPAVIRFCMTLRTENNSTDRQRTERKQSQSQKARTNIVRRSSERSSSMHPQCGQLTTGLRCPSLCARSTSTTRAQPSRRPGTAPRQNGAGTRDSLATSRRCWSTGRLCTCRAALCSPRGCRPNASRSGSRSAWASRSREMKRNTRRQCEDQLAVVTGSHRDKLVAIAQFLACTHHCAQSFVAAENSPTIIGPMCAEDCLSTSYELRHVCSMCCCCDMRSSGISKTW